METIDKLPETPIVPSGPISEKFLSLGIKNFQEACLYAHNLEYGYNSDYDDKFIMFKEQKASCTMKHATIAGLAEELGIGLTKNIMVYKLTEEITTGVGEITSKYNIPYIPLTHCFLMYENSMFDLTEGNKNGKKNNPATQSIYYEKVDPFISKNDEYRFFKRILKEKIITSEEMQGIKEITLLKAREEAIKLLHESIK